MKRNLIALLYSLFWVAGLSGQGNYWQEAPGPYGGKPLQVVRTPSGALYLVNPAYNVYRSDDNGLNWTKIKNSKIEPSSHDSWQVTVGLAGNLYKTIAYPNGQTRIYRSTDDGETWPLLHESDSLISVTELSGGVLLATSTAAIYRSANQGQTWQKTHETTVGNATLRLTPSGEVWLQDDFETFLRSTDQGFTWKKLTVPTSRFYFVTSTGVIFLSGTGSSAGILYRSGNGGQSFQNIQIDTSGNSISLGSMAELPSGRLLLANYGKTYFSDNQGLTWHPWPLSFYTGALYPFATLPDGTIFCHNEFPNSLYRSADGGYNWQFSANGIRKGGQNDIYFKSPDTLYCADEYLWRSYDGGAHWSAVTDFSTGRVYSMEAIGHSDSIFFHQGDKILFSPDGGETVYDRTPPGLTVDLPQVYTHFTAVDYLRFDDRTGALFASFDTTLLRSYDLGQNWEVLSDSVSTIRLLFHPGGRIFYLTGIITHDSLDYFFTPELWISDNNGTSWEVVPGFASDNYIRSICLNPQGEVFVVTVKGLYMSSDTGATWQKRSGPVPINGWGFFKYDLFSADNGFLFCLGNWDLYMSTDKGASWQIVPTVTDDIYLSNTGQYVQNIFFFLSPDQRLYASARNGLLRSANPVYSGSFIEGKVLRDADNDCSTPDAQTPLASWVVEANGAFDYFTVTDTSGAYRLFVDTGVYQVNTRKPNVLWWESCENDTIVNVSSLFTTDTLDLTVRALAECPLMSAMVTVPGLRRCFNNVAYVHYCNQGTETADSAWVDVSLDPYLSLVTSAQPHDSLGNNVYRFYLGGVETGECGQFSLTVHVNCDSTVLGQTHCISVHAFPDTLCVPVPGWSGAEIVASAQCLDSIVQVRLNNNGNSVSQLLDYIIIEDDVVLMSGKEQYDPNETLTLNLPANGHTWRIESQQEPGHPFSGVALAFTEGCGGFASLGFINQFDVNGYQPSRHRVCLENIGAYDPNDKQGFPLGTGVDHLIRPGQEIDYLIRFQNTGTDTAFNVVVRDTLSPWLDPASVRPGAASHPYTWELNGQGAIQFTFINILLPDSNTNLAGSQGFVSFRIAQRPDVPLGTNILNTAAIYFDFNAPVMTNQTRHRVGKDYLTATHSPAGIKQPNAVDVSPNPATVACVFQLNTGDFRGHRLFVTDVLGRKAAEAVISGKQYRFERNGLPAGAYFFLVEDAAGKRVDAGKIVFE